MTNNFATNLTVLKTTMKKKEWPILGSHICSIKIQNLTVPIINIYINNLFQSFVFFGESLGDEFHNSVAKDKNEADLLIMIGSSLKVNTGPHNSWLLTQYCFYNV